jgi:hypothetical protein
VFTFNAARPLVQLSAFATYRRQQKDAAAAREVRRKREEAEKIAGVAEIACSSASSPVDRMIQFGVLLNYALSDDPCPVKPLLTEECIRRIETDGLAGAADTAAKLRSYMKNPKGVLHLGAVDSGSVAMVAAGWGRLPRLLRRPAELVPR